MARLNSDLSDANSVNNGMSIGYLIRHKSVLKEQIFFNSKGDNFKDKHFQTSFARTICIILSHFSDFIGA